MHGPLCGIPDENANSKSGEEIVKIKWENSTKQPTCILFYFCKTIPNSSRVSEIKNT